MTIKIKGIIGWDVVGANFSDMFAKLSGDVDIEIDSPGGSVFDGISIYNAIKKYCKGKTNIRVVGEACSMAAYIMLAGDTLTFEPNAIVMLHNPFNGIVGDYRAMYKNASLLERLAALYANAFVEKGIYTEKEIRDVMDAETWYVGAEELAKLGEIAKTTDNNEPPQEADKEITIAAAREHLRMCQAKIRESEANACEFDRIAALLPPMQKPATGAQSVTTEKDTVTVQKKGEEIMDLKELQTQNPDVYAAAIKAGVEQEKSRVNALMKFIEVDRETVVKAISEGKSIQDDEIQSNLLMAKINAKNVKAMEEENPPAVNPNEPPHAPEGGEGQEPSEEEKAKQAADAEAKNLDKVLGFLGYEK